MFDLILKAINAGITLAGIVSGEDIERCQQEAMARFEDWRGKDGKI